MLKQHCCNDSKTLITYWCYFPNKHFLCCYRFLTLFSLQFQYNIIFSNPNKANRRSNTMLAAVSYLYISVISVEELQ